MEITVDFTSEEPIYQQIQRQIIALIASSALQQGDALPSVRDLGNQAGINPMTVHKAYQMLASEGFLQLRPRKAALVCSDAYRFGKGARRRLKALVHEAKIAGLSKKQLLALIDAYYEEETE